MRYENKVMDALWSRHLWPETKPDIPFKEDGWFPKCNQEALKTCLSNATIIIELGSWLGLSTRWLLDNSKADVIAIDHWNGSTPSEKIPLLYETFLSNCWGYRNRLIPMRTTTLVGIEEVRKMGIKPNLIYVDAGHDYDSALADIKACLEFEHCILVGDDFNPNSWPGVVRAVWEEANNAGLDLRVHGSAWTIGAK